jgi:hypothetical protein
MSSDNEQLILETLLSIKEDMGKLVGAKQAHEDRIKHLEDDQTRQWYVHACVVPIVFALHKLATALHWIKI